MAMLEKRQETHVEQSHGAMPAVIADALDRGQRSPIPAAHGRGIGQVRDPKKGERVPDLGREYVVPAGLGQAHGIDEELTTALAVAVRIALQAHAAGQEHGLGLDRRIAESRTGLHLLIGEVHGRIVPACLLQGISFGQAITELLHGGRHGRVRGRPQTQAQALTVAAVLDVRQVDDGLQGLLHDRGIGALEAADQGAQPARVSVQAEGVQLQGVHGLAAVDVGGLTGGHGLVLPAPDPVIEQGFDAS
jgi:hypothetical protein